MAISGDTVLVGAPGEDGGSAGVNGDESDDSASEAGAAYVFVRNGTDWTQQAYLKASNAEAFDTFGVSVAIDGDVAVIGAGNEDGASKGVDGNQADNGATNSGAADRTSPIASRSPGRSR